MGHACVFVEGSSPLTTFQVFVDSPHRATIPPAGAGKELPRYQRVTPGYFTKQVSNSRAKSPSQHPPTSHLAQRATEPRPGSSLRIWAARAHPWTQQSVCRMAVAVYDQRSGITQRPCNRHFSGPLETRLFITHCVLLESKTAHIGDTSVSSLAGTTPATSYKTTSHRFE